MWDRPRYRGSTAFTKPAKAGGRRCRSVPPVTATRHINRLSSFAGNGLLISPDWLIEDELLRASDCQVRSFPQNAVDYDAVIPFKHGLLETAWANFSAGARADLRAAYRAVPQ